MISKAVDTYLVYQFLRKLTLPFTKWKAYKTGVIDENGNIIVDKRNRTQEQQKSFLKFDLMVMKLKKLLAKIPGGSSKIASYMAALWLIKEWNHFTDGSVLLESISDSDIDESLFLFLEWYLYYIPIIEEVNQKVMEDAPTVNVGSGAIAGLGVGPQGEPGLTKDQQRRHRIRASSTTAKRKTFASWIQEEDEEPIYVPYDTQPTNVRRRRKVRKHPIPSERIA